MRTNATATEQHKSHDFIRRGIDFIIAVVEKIPFLTYILFSYKLH